MFYVLRHGQTDWNAALRLQGSTDIALNEIGREQARVAAQLLTGQGLTKIVASPLSRARETAEIVGHAVGLEVETDPRLIERNFGAFEGLTLPEVEVLRRDMGAIMNPEADLDGRHYPLDAEPLSAVFKRVSSSLIDHRKNNAVSLFVFHGIPFRVVSKLYLGEMHTSPNASPVRFEPVGDGWHMSPLDPGNTPLSQHQNLQTSMGRF
ncbi:histidine phosphatase family protein [Asticcacaulis machinosus]|uniref:Histidine phosphatase family protein n=1 Tax=Asticcacaulis machinosus TaxID=2984211 RepID=A0ABT5HJA2_9CAUL|nr:histidine phosphatase family protein [Asticcacaulis machinosus]MDC7675684.1 histidine phosphatase family protein [Asticcacaulis machinosus]